jgi:PhzF family phenazine biosynthesis protein
VFTAVPYRGNPLAVVLDGSGLEPQRNAALHQLDQPVGSHLPAATHPGRRRTTSVRIFCPGRELPFAGHPTLGSCHAWLEAGGRPQGEHIVQECGVGLVKLRRDGRRLAFAAPPLRKGGPLPEDDVALIARGLGVARGDITAHAWCDNGPNWRGVMLKSADQVLALKPDAAILAGLDIGVVGPRGQGRCGRPQPGRTTSLLKCAPSSPATTAWPKTRSPAA